MTKGLDTTAMAFCYDSELQHAQSQLSVSLSRPEKHPCWLVLRRPWIPPHTGQKHNSLPSMPPIQLHLWQSQPGNISMFSLVFFLPEKEIILLWGANIFTPTRLDSPHKRASVGYSGQLCWTAEKLGILCRLEEKPVFVSFYWVYFTIRPRIGSQTFGSCDRLKKVCID